jgi:hypothetical protein
LANPRSTKALRAKFNKWASPRIKGYIDALTRAKTARVGTLFGAVRENMNPPTPKGAKKILHLRKVGKAP